MPQNRWGRQTRTHASCRDNSACRFHGLPDTGLTLPSPRRPRRPDILRPRQRLYHPVRARLRLAEQPDIRARRAVPPPRPRRRSRLPPTGLDHRRSTGRAQRDVGGRPRMAFACSSNSLCTWVGMPDGTDDMLVGLADQLELIRRVEALSCQMPGQQHQRGGWPDRYNRLPWHLTTPRLGFWMPVRGHDATS